VPDDNQLVSLPLLPPPPLLLLLLVLLVVVVVVVVARVYRISARKRAHRSSSPAARWRDSLAVFVDPPSATVRRRRRRPTRPSRSPDRHRTADR